MATRRRMSIAALLAAGLLAACAPAPARFEDILLSRADWNVGKVSAVAKQRLSVFVTNAGSVGRKLSILSSCPCIEISKPSILLSPGERQELGFVFDPGGIPGPIAVVLVFLTDAPESKGYLMRMHGSAEGLPAKQ